MANYEAALQAVTTANGYRRSLNLVDRFQSRGMDQQGQALVEIKQGVDVVNESLASMGNQGAEGHTLAIQTILKFRHDPAEDSLSTDTVGNIHEQDIYKAVMVDATRGGLAFDTRWVSTDEIELDEEGNRAVKAISFEVDYRHELGDMTI